MCRSSAVWSVSSLDPGPSHIAQPSRGGRPPPNAGCETARRRLELSAGEREMGDAAGGADRLHIEALLERLQPVPEAFPASENYGDDRYVHVVDQVGGEKLADYRWSSANADVQRSEE